VYDDNNKKVNGGPSYFDYLNNMGAGDVRLNTESEDTMDFINRVVNDRNKDSKIP
jgi:hypothetical protein